MAPEHVDCLILYSPILIIPLLMAHRILVSGHKENLQATAMTAPKNVPIFAILYLVILLPLFAIPQQAIPQPKNVVIHAENANAAHYHNGMFGLKVDLLSDKNKW